ncbi:PadR family transcriptional regulator [Ornithinimicrobium tianjinense]|uniref:Transcriptional regulator n=1 Tax=Ornithinimicrobium tianjinense TaxID=1195761 RepID=A0A917BGN7_9MICO|nr:PadR family transcriptional regulator [Ornithinimicrobium tianjinense]GGF44289.1 transcriptional regulator [Ornithinimicrobium tianjinense]
MSVKHSLLALLGEGPQYGAALRSEFESRTGGTWPLNVGQVYTTLGRLERDGLVVKEVVPEGAGDSSIRYAVTPAGRDEVARWWVEPVDRASTPRQELAMKLALAVTVPGVDVTRTVQVQRRATMQHLQELTRLKRTGGADLAWSLVLENLIFTAEAELRWLDHVEAQVTRAAGAARVRAHRGDVASSAVTEQDAEAPGTGPAHPSVTAGARPGARR